MPAEAYAEIAAQYRPEEVGLIIAINAWNTVSVTTRAWLPGSYQP